MLNKSSGVSEFVLICFPGLQNWQHWLAMPIALLLLATVASNITLMATVFSSPVLQQPMYDLICLLAALDLLISFSVSPKTLAILWFDQKIISPIACFWQMFMVPFCYGTEACIFTCLAYDRYIAICDPLHHSYIITRRKTAMAAALLIIGNTAIFMPFPLMASMLNYCTDNVIQHCFCENMPVVKLACDSSAGNNIYNLVIIPLYIVILSLVLFYSYGMILRVVVRLDASATLRKALGTCTSHLILICFLYSTLIMVAIFNRLQPSVPRYVGVMMSLLHSLVCPALNPMVYGIRTNEIRQELLKLSGRIWKVHFHC
ncbi:olfactory receptor 56A4-like [Ambystoma mexicanum]|uniref:olfactory receptor 56A4-like n=1 Tax=Ambystoma mexicanum TaxID=8296 RepID=UPI0037E7EA3E